MGPRSPLRQSGRPPGWKDLTDIARIRPRLSVFGHIHEGYGVWGHCVNAAICDQRYRLANPPIVVDLRPGGDPFVLVEPS